MPKAPFVAMLTDLCKEERVSVVADIAGYCRDEALGRLFRMWAWCTDRGLEDAPEDCEGYAVPDAVVRRFLGPRGVEAILGDGCDDLALGVRRDDGRIYLRDTSETVARLRKLRATASAGGQTRRDAPRDEDGRFVGERTNGPADGPADVQLATSKEPARTSEIPQTTDHRPDPDLELGGVLVLTAPVASRRHKPKRSRPAPSRAIPGDWSPRPEERAKAARDGLDADAEAERFRDHHAAKGSTFVDWDAAFRTWLGNSLRFSSDRAGPRGSAGRAREPEQIRKIPTLS